MDHFIQERNIAVPLFIAVGERDQNSELNSVETKSGRVFKYWSELVETIKEC